jgi:hypothetical protein
VPSKGPAHVFISYIAADSSVALRIAKELRQLGYETWAYEENGLPGHSYLEQVRFCHRLVRCVLVTRLDRITEIAPGPLRG